MPILNRIICGHAVYVILLFSHGQFFCLTPLIFVGDNVYLLMLTDSHI